VGTPSLLVYDPATDRIVIQLFGVQEAGELADLLGEICRRKGRQTCWARSADGKGGAELSLRERARRVKMVLMDVDGILTDGRLYYTEEGERVKVFSVHDGIGIKLLQRAGILTGVLSGRESPALERRLRELGLDEILMGRAEKGEVLSHLVLQRNISEEEIAFIGDDLVDIPVLKRVGFPVTVAKSIRIQLRPEGRRVANS